MAIAKNPVYMEIRVRQYEEALYWASPEGIAEKARIAQQTTEANYLGLSLSQYQTMLSSRQGVSNIEGLKLYKPLATLG